MQQRSLITGAAGFIGAALAARLSEDPDHALILVDSIEPGNADDNFLQLVRRPNVEFRRLDLTDAAEVARLPTEVDTVYHLAAVIGVEQVLRAPDRVLEVNAVSTLNIFNYARTLNKLRRLLFSSTSEVYSGTLRHYGIPLPTPETVSLCVDDVTAPRTSYALSKMYGEAVAFAWRNVHHVPVTVVRYHNVYGPRMGFRHVIPQTFVKIRDFERRNRRSFAEPYTRILLRAGCSRGDSPVRRTGSDRGTDYPHWLLSGGNRHSRPDSPDCERNGNNSFNQRTAGHTGFSDAPLSRYVGAPALHWIFG